MGSGKREPLDGAGAWRSVSLEGWRNSASELCVYLAGAKKGTDPGCHNMHATQLVQPAAANGGNTV